MLTTGELYNDLGGDYFRTPRPRTHHQTTRRPTRSARTPRHPRGAAPGRLNQSPPDPDGIFLSDDPFIFAGNANEPKAENLKQVTFHWVEGRTGAKKLGALLGLQPAHRGRDLQREQLEVTGAPAASESYLALTYTTHNGGARGGRRFDSMWASQEFVLRNFSCCYETALAAGTDHALLLADLDLSA